MTRTLLGVVLALAFALPTVLAGTNEEERYSDQADATGFHTQKKMARAADGALFSTYVRPVGDNDTQVVVVRDEADLPAVKAARGHQTRPTLALDANGDLRLAWQELAQSDREVFAARYHAGRWVDVAQLSDGAGYAGFPSMATTADGHVHVAWYGFDGTSYQTFYRERAEGAWLPEVQFASGPLDANNPSLVADASGGLHIAWYKDEGKRYSLWYAHRAPGAAAWDPPRRLPQGPGDALNIALAVAADGTLHAAWDERTENATRIMHAAIGAAAAPLGEGEYPAIARFGDDILVAWAAPDGTLMGSDLAHPAAPLLGGVQARNPSLRGPTPIDPDPRLDILWAQPEDATFAVRTATIEPWCSPFAASCGPRPNAPLLPLAGLLALALGAAFRRRGHNR